jgi:EpsI family protein
MSERSPVPRALLLAACLLVGAVAIGRASKTEVTPPRQSFATFPMTIREWRGESTDRFDQRVLTVLGVDEYINRIYRQPAGAPLGLYIGFYRSQREGDTMHSPLNCLPGAGWEPLVTDRIPITVRRNDGPDTARITVNRVVIQKGLDRQVVVYWYQSHGRVVASEYWGKVFTVLDAIRLNRTDAAMIRVVCPVAPGRAASTAEAAATREAHEFVQAMFPLLSRYLPD